MSNIVDYAKSELDAAGFFDEESDYNGMLGEAVVELIEKFDNQDHSGFSAHATIELFSRLARYKPLTPLTGDSEEWVEVSDGLFQNKRAGNVFAEDENGKNAYDIEGLVFVDKTGMAFTNSESLTYIEFPYVPEPTIIEEDTPDAEEYKHVFVLDEEE
jgi:hypothetical protein